MLLLRVIFFSSPPDEDDEDDEDEEEEEEEEEEEAVVALRLRLPTSEEGEATVAPLPLEAMAAMGEEGSGQSTNFSQKSMSSPPSMHRWQKRKEGRPGSSASRFA